MMPISTSAPVVVAILREWLVDCRAEELAAADASQAHVRQAPIDEVRASGPTTTRRLHQAAERAYHRRAALSAVLSWLAPAPADELPAAPAEAQVLALLSVAEQDTLSRLLRDLYEQERASGAMALHPMTCDGFGNAEDAQRAARFADDAHKKRQLILRLCRLNGVQT